MSLTVDDVKAAKRRDDLVPGYADWIRQSQRGETIRDLVIVHQAIVRRWSVAALYYIKKQAWKQVFPHAR